MIIVVTNDSENWIEEVDVDEAIAEAIKNGNEWIKVSVEKPVKYDSKYDEYYNEELFTTEVSLEDLDISLSDVLEYCQERCKE
jgi:hypothetical protein